MENPSFYLEGVVRERSGQTDFEGPLSLILMLLSRNKIEIRDVSISEILDQYLDYLDQMQSMDLEIASEFVQMAAQLLYIKTRMLLSSEEEVTELELLLQSLEQLKAKDVYSAVRQVTPELRKAAEQGMLYFEKLPEPPGAGSRDYAYRHEPVDLLRALYSVFSRTGRAPEQEEAFSAIIPKPVVYSVRSKSRQILERLRGGRITLEELYSACRSRGEVVATFVSVLELCNMGSVRISGAQGRYTLSFVGGDTEEILEKIEE